MSGLDMLDVGIGLAFLYLMMSLVCSAAVEILESALHYRASDLETGIRELLNHDSSLTEALYNHPLISSLYRGSYAALKPGEGLWKRFVTRWRLPSYIPSRNFSLALIQLVLGDAAVDGTTPPTPTPFPTGTNAPAARTTMVLPSAGALAAQVKPDVVKAITCLVTAAAHDAEKARQNIEEWFNTSMDRVSGWYKRRTQVFLLIAGIAAAAAFNIDSISIVELLSTNKDIRQAIVSEANAYMATKPVGQPGQDTAPSQTTPLKERTARLENDLGTLQKVMKAAGVPLGWYPRDWPQRNTRLYPCVVTDWHYLNGWAVKLFGLFITACAVSLGAPFWFDTLNKFIVVRSTVKPKEKSGPEASKDPQGR